MHHCRPLSFITADDPMEPEPVTLPRPRAHSGVVLRPAAPDEITAVDLPRPEMAAEPELEPAPAANVEADGDESGVYPIFDDGAAALRWMQHRRDVAKHTREIEERPDDPTGWLARANVHHEHGHLREALDDCARALSLRPALVDAHVRRAAIHAELGLHEEVLVDASRALRVDSRRVDAYRLRATARLALADHAGAVGDYDHAIVLDSSDASLFRDRGDVKSRMGDLAGALDDLNVAAAMNPNDEATLLQRAIVKLLLADGRLDWNRAAAKALEQLALRASGASPRPEGANTSNDEGGRIA